MVASQYPIGVINAEYFVLGQSRNLPALSGSAGAVQLDVPKVSQAPVLKPSDWRRAKLAHSDRELYHLVHSLKSSYIHMEPPDDDSGYRQRYPSMQDVMP
jgi:hypothetical protein